MVKLKMHGYRQREEVKPVTLASLRSDCSAHRPTFWQALRAGDIDIPDKADYTLKPMTLRKGASVAIKTLVCIVLISILAAWVIPCHEDALVCEGSLAHSNCNCAGHLVPYLSSAFSAPQGTFPAAFFHPVDIHLPQKIFGSEIYRPPRA
jgi:hypothetical protein